MKIFVTGGTGFVGQELVSLLLAKGHTVKCLVRTHERGERLLPPGVDLTEGDIIDPEGLREAIAGCDAVVNLVGIIMEKGKNTFESVQYQGTVNMVDATKAAGIRRFIQMSALGSRPDAVATYHKTKWRAEEYLRNSGLDYTIFRPSVIFGPHDLFTNFFARLIKMAPVFVVIGTGATRIQPVHVEDVSSCFVAALEKWHTAGKAYDIGGPQACTWDEMFDTLMKVIEKKRPKIHLPISLVMPVAFLAERLPLAHPPITREQLIMLQEDNICDNSSLLRDCGVKLHGFEEGMRSYLRQ